MLCACSSHPITGKKKIIDFITVVAPRTTESHGRNCCVRTRYLPEGYAAWNGDRKPNPVIFERIDR